MINIPFYNMRNYKGEYYIDDESLENSHPVNIAFARKKLIVIPPCG
jgi:hypothetical protein